LGRKGYLALQTCDGGWDYTLYNKDFTLRGSGQLDSPELSAEEARELFGQPSKFQRGYPICFLKNSRKFSLIAIAYRQRNFSNL